VIPLDICPEQSDLICVATRNEDIGVRVRVMDCDKTETDKCSAYMRREDERIFDYVWVHPCSVVILLGHVDQA
jgi:hypothetical protein